MAVIAGAAADARQAEEQSLLRKKYKLHPGDSADLVDYGNVLAYLEDAARASLVQDILTKAKRGTGQVLLSLINYGECIYIVERERGLLQAQTMIGMVDQLPIEIIEVDGAHVCAAAHLKACFPIAYADAFAVSLAQQRQAIVLTGDPEFPKIEHLVTVQWLSED